MEEKKRINLCLAHMSEEGWEQKYVKEAFDTNWVVPLGPNVDAFESDLESFLGEGKRVAALSSGTAAVHLSLVALDVKPGDEVICQSFTFAASCNPIVYQGATPVFVDSEPDTWNMDPNLLEEAIKDRLSRTGRLPKAIVLVCLYGMPPKYEEILPIAQRYGIPVVEDAAEAFGSKYKGRLCGTFGQFGVLSFNGNKMITTSGGGALVCPDEETKRRVLFYATQAREPFPYYQHEKIGYNYRMSNICAGIGRGQMTVLEDHLAHHKHVQKMYEELLKDVKGIHVHSQPVQGSGLMVNGSEIPMYDSNYWLCTMTIDPEVRIKGQENAYKTVVKGAVGGAAGVIHIAESATTDCQPNDNVEALRVLMDQAQIEARPLWKPMHCQPVYRRVGVENLEFRIENLPNGIVRQTSDASVAYINGVSEALFKVGMCLPAGPYVTDDDVRYIVETIKAAIVG
jgi:dTDP-4-amino-4,6-dideoxygalactose transaminase